LDGNDFCILTARPLLLQAQCMQSTPRGAQIAALPSLLVPLCTSPGAYLAA